MMVSLSPAALDAFLGDSDTSPFVMLNLIRFVPDGGRERYLEYLRLARPILVRFGAEIVYSGDALPALTEGDDREWEAATLVRYPNRGAFRDMVADPEYQTVFKVGAGAIADILLQPLVAYQS